SGIVQGLMPGAFGGFIERLRRNPVMSLLGLMVAWQLFDVVYHPVFNALLRLLHPGVAYSSNATPTALSAALGRRTRMHASTPSRMRRAPLAAVSVVVLLSAAPSHAQPKRAAPPRDWRTPAEAGDYRTTPRYAETMEYVRRVVAAAPRQARLMTFGRSGEGRDLMVAVLSKDGVFSPAALHRAG